LRILSPGADRILTHSELNTPAARLAILGASAETLDEFRGLRQTFE
jgi:hypothetical protein